MKLAFHVNESHDESASYVSPTRPNTAPSTGRNAHHWSFPHMKRYLQCAEQRVSLSNVSKYCACQEGWFPWLILVTAETLCTMRGVTSVIVLTHQISRLPRQMNLMIDPCHTLRLFTMRGATCVIAQTHQILRLPRKITVQNHKEICWKQLKRHFHCAADPIMIRELSDRETVSPQPASRPRLLFTPTTSIMLWKIQHFAVRLSFQISLNTATLQLHQILCLPRKLSLRIIPFHTWNVILNARSNKCYCPSSPNTAPATKIEYHDWSVSQMKRHFQCAERHVSLSKLTKYDEMIPMTVPAMSFIYQKILK